MGGTFASAGEGYGNCRAVETVEKRTACFSTVPTALGKLGKTNCAEFSTVPTAPTAVSFLGKRRKSILATEVGQNSMDNRLSEV